jgi:hypothetical protein
MGFGKVNQAFRVFFSVRLGTGLPATGVASGNFTVTVRNPQNTATMAAPTITEVGGGQYLFDISATFSNTHGAGEYGVTISVNSTSPNVRDTMGGLVVFFASNPDDLATDIAALPSAAAVSTQVWGEALPGAFTLGEAGERLATTDDRVDQALSTTEANIRGADSDDLKDISDEIAAVQADTNDIQTRLPAALVGGRMDSDVGNMQAAVLTQINTQLEVTSGHGAGSWAGVATAPQVIRDAMKLAPTAGAPAAGSVDLHLDDIEADTTNIQTRLPAALVGGRMDSDVAVIQAAALTQINTQLEVTSGHGAGSWATATGFAVAGDAMALTPAERTTLSGVIDTALGVSHGGGSWITATGFAVAGDAMTLTAGERTTLAGVVDTTLTAAHGLGSWATAAALTAQGVRDAMKLSPTAGAPAVDSVDEHLDDILADTAAIDLRLPADPADQSLLVAEHTQTQADIAALNDLAAVDILLVKQTYAYDKTNDNLEGMVWVESLGGQIVTPTSVSVDIRDVDNALLFNMTDAAPDAAGFFKVTRAAPGFTTGLAFKAVAAVTVPVVGVLTSGYGMFTIG